MLHDIQKLFGPPPVLATESVQAYNRVMLQFIICIVPRDFVEQMFVKHLTDNAWYILRYMRYQTVYVEWKHNQLREARAQSGKVVEAPTEFDYAEAIERGIDPIRYLDNLLNTRYRQVQRNSGASGALSRGSCPRSVFRDQEDH
jgi:hypothetical protein